MKPAWKESWHCSHTIPTLTILKTQSYEWQVKTNYQKNLQLKVEGTRETMTQFCSHCSFHLEFSKEGRAGPCLQILTFGMSSITRSKPQTPEMRNKTKKLLRHFIFFPFVSSWAQPAQVQTQVLPFSETSSRKQPRFMQHFEQSSETLTLFRPWVNICLATQVWAVVPEQGLSK